MLRDDHQATYDQVRRAAAERGLAIDPSMFGSIRKRARARREEVSPPPVDRIAGDRLLFDPGGLGPLALEPDLSTSRAPVAVATEPVRNDVCETGGPPAPSERSFQPLPEAKPRRTRTSARPPAALLEDFMRRVRHLEADTARCRQLLTDIRRDVTETLGDLDG